MMLARQAVFGGVGEHVMYDLAQGFLRQDVVTDMVHGHDRPFPPECALPARFAVESSAGSGECQCERRKKKRKWRLLLPGASEPRLTELNPPGLQFGLSNRLRGLSNRSIVVVCNYGLAR